jgi:hypothetical protein
MSLILLKTPLSPSPPASGGEPPDVAPFYRHARSGVCEAGTCISGLVFYRLRVTANDVAIGMLIGSGFRISHAVGRPSTCTFSTLSPLQEGQQIKIIDDGAHHLLFGGTVDTVSFTKQDGAPTIYDIACTDWVWLANKDTEIYETFVNVDVNTAVTRVIEYTDPAIGIMPGSIPESLGKINMTIDGSNFEQAINDIAKAAKSNWKLTAHKRLDMYQTEVPSGHVLTLVNDSRVKILAFQNQLSQIRTRVTGLGGGSQTSGVTLYGSSTIEVKETGWYSSSGGTVKITGLPPLTYTGVSTASGPGFITGVSGLTRDIADSETVNVFVELNDATAQSQLAARLSGGGAMTGVATYRFSDQRLSLQELTNRCQMYLDFFKIPIQQATYSMGMPDFYYNSQRRWEVGKLVSVTIDTPHGEVTGTLRLSELTIEGLADVSMDDGMGQSWETQRSIILRPGARQGILDLMVEAN